ncbi:MAG TPA: hypothetical protein GXX51_05655 [Firmicutes bacterium]|nr:hypothetical protein [Bacillota bacterium]
MIALIKRLVETTLEELGLVQKQEPEYKHVRLELGLAELLKSIWEEHVVRALGKAIERVRAARENLENEVIAAMEVFREELGESFASKSRSGVEKLLYTAYRLGREEIAREVLLEVVFDQKDRWALDALNNHSVYWIGSYYDRFLGSKITGIAEGLLEQGLGRRELADALRAQLGETLAEGYFYWDVLASSVIQRSRTIGGVNSLIAADVKSYRILAMMDERSCPVCRAMDGKVFTISHAVKLRDKLLQAMNPEDVKAIAPWIPGDRLTLDWLTRAAPDEIAAKGMNLPPFHGRCRCTFVVEEFVGPASPPENYSELQARVEGWGRRLAGFEWKGNSWRIGPHKEMVLKEAAGYWDPVKKEIVIDEEYVERLKNFFASPGSISSDREKEEVKFSLGVLIHEAVHACEDGFLVHLYRHDWGKALVEGLVQGLVEGVYQDVVTDMKLTRKAKWIASRCSFWDDPNWKYSGYTGIVNTITRFCLSLADDPRLTPTLKLYQWAIRTRAEDLLQEICDDILRNAFRYTGMPSPDLSEQMRQELHDFIMEALQTATSDPDAAKKLGVKLQRWRRKIQRL